MSYNKIFSTPYMYSPDCNTRSSTCTVGGGILTCFVASKPNPGTYLRVPLDEPASLCGESPEIQNGMRGRYFAATKERNCIAAGRQEHKR